MSHQENVGTTCWPSRVRVRAAESAVWSTDMSIIVKITTESLPLISVDTVHILPLRKLTGKQKKN